MIGKKTFLFGTNMINKISPIQYEQNLYSPKQITRAFLLLPCPLIDKKRRITAFFLYEKSEEN